MVSHFISLLIWFPFFLHLCPRNILRIALIPRHHSRLSPSLLFFPSLFPSGLLSSSLFYSPLLCMLEPRHKAENISNLGWGICLFTARPRNNQAVGLTKAVINGQPESELWATRQRRTSRGEQHTATRSVPTHTIYPATDMESSIQRLYGEERWRKKREHEQKYKKVTEGA